MNSTCVEWALNNTAIVCLIFILGCVVGGIGVAAIARTHIKKLREQLAFVHLARAEREVQALEMQ